MIGVVVTGIGLVTPLGVGVNKNWESLIKGKSGISKLEFRNGSPFPYELPVKVAASVPRGNDAHQFNEQMIPNQFRLASADFVKYAIVASQEALRDSNQLDIALSESEELQTRAGVCIGSGVGTLDDIIVNQEKIREGSINKVSAYFIPRMLINEVSGIVSIINKLRGPNLSVVTACATGAHAIGESFRKIKYGDADIMVAGGTESSINPLSIIGFSRMKALSTRFNDDPERASRPFDKQRDGFVMGEGAGILVLEEYEHALKRGAKIYCEITGYGLTGDAHHISAPNPDGNGPLRSMSLAIKESSIKPTDIDYFNAHATSTPIGDGIECFSIIKLLGQEINSKENSKITMSSNKGSIGHLLGAAGSVESIFTILSLKNNIVPPTINLEEISPDYGINLVPKIAQEKQLKYVLKNSFGFGGTNASLVFSKIN
eukprot:gene7995-9837_t